ncbi:unannotated protein [freshwater metagenome]|uniref:Unannotated protein n=1 Tax=freshwater metagenome TaxID=449393 RepID=A0A6J7ML23_9ZZZZ
MPSPATSSVFFATSLTSSAPIFSHGSSSSISFAIETPSFVIVGAPHFFSKTTFRPRGPRVTFTASANWFIPRSRPRRASSLKAIIFAIVIPLLFIVESGVFYHSHPSSANAKSRVGIPSQANRALLGLVLLMEPEASGRTLLGPSIPQAAEPLNQHGLG